VALLGIAWAGGAYLPLDPDFPVPRLRLMLEDSQAPIIVTHLRLHGTFLATGAEVLSLEHDVAYKGEAATAPRPVEPEDLAYVIYTSGSTGRPKGVEVPHRA